MDAFRINPKNWRGSSFLGLGLGWLSAIIIVVLALNPSNLAGVVIEDGFAVVDHLIVEQDGAEAECELTDRLSPMQSTDDLDTCSDDFSALEDRSFWWALGTIVALGAIGYFVYRVVDANERMNRALGVMFMLGVIAVLAFWVGLNWDDWGFVLRFYLYGLGVGATIVGSVVSCGFYYAAFRRRDRYGGAGS